MSPGDLVGEYRLEAPLGRGGFGEVFSAVHPVIGKQVAIKILRPEAATDPDAVTRFTAEAAAVNRIAHPSIVDVFAFGQTADGRHYYVMELLRGESLDKRLAAGRLSLDESLPILRGIATALDAAHTAGFVHRDLKPENVFLIGKDVKLIDFGLAKLVAGQSADGPSRAGQIFGTPHYMAPEQCRGRAVDRATDVYAVGVIAFRMLTGRLPFDADEALDVLLQHVHDEPPRPSSIVPLPAHVDAALLAMLAKNPEQRPRSASDAVDLLSAADAPSVPADRRWLRPWHVAAPLALGGVVIAVIAITSDPTPARPTTPPPSELRATTPEPRAEPTSAAPVVAPIDASTGVVVRVESNVPAALWRDGAKVGDTPFDLAVGRGEIADVELRARGRATKRQRLDTSRDHTVLVELADAPPPKRPGPDDLEVHDEP